MHFLLIDTASERGIVAISDGYDLLFQRELPCGFYNSHHLLPTIAEALSITGLKPQKLNAIAVGCGPGTYTGMRVGAMTAKALAYGSHIPLIGLCSLNCYKPQKEGSFVTLIDAKMGGVYCLAGIRKNDELCYNGMPQIGPLKDFVELLLQVEQIVTPFALHLQKKVAAELPLKSFSWQEGCLDALRMGHLAREKYQQGAIEPLELLYMHNTI